MSGTSAVAVAKANRGASAAGPQRSQSGAVIEAFGNLFRTHARKTLARFLGLSEGAAKKKLSGERELSLNEFATLLRTDHGFAYLTAVMADSEVKWWRIMRPLMEVAEITEMQLAARRKLKRVMHGAMNADTDLAATIARADALLVQDPDFYRPQADAVRAVARVPGRPMAAAGRRR